MHDLSVSSYAFTLRLCLVLAMAFALGACGDNAEPAAKTPSAADASSTACAPDTGTVSPDTDSASGSSPSSPTDTDPADSATTPCAEDPNAPTDTDSTPDPDSGSPSDNSTDSSDDGPTSPSCDRSGFTPAVHQASYAQGAFRYQASTSEAAPFDAVFIDSFFEQYGGPSTPGSYSLEGFNYADCGLCLLATLGCTSQGCDTYFYADAGALDITAFGQDGQAFTGVMRDVIFREVTIDSQTYQSTPVPGGQVWCMDGYTFDVTVGAGNVPVSADTPIGDDSSGPTNGGPTTDTTDSGESDGGSGSSSDNGTSPTPSGDGVDALGNQNHTLDSVTMTVVASQFEGLNAPTDLEFNPLRSGELWVVNQGDDTTTVLFSPEADETWLCNAGYYNTNDGCDCGCGIPDPDCPSSSVDACEYGCGPGQQPNPNNPSQCIITGASGTPSEAFPRFIKRVPGDSTNSHFLAKPSALAFGENGAFASIHEEDEITQFDTPWDFMGPTLWTTEFALFDSGHLSHIDMLHNTPNGVGIAWEVDNVYWVYDGHHGSLTRYNFNQDHGPAGTDHSDGVVYRYVDGQLGYQPGVPSHLVFEPSSERVFAADTANGKIMVLDAKTGQLGSNIEPNYDGTVQRYMNGASLSTLVDGASVGLQKPSGLELHDGLLYVSDYQSSKIFAFTLNGELVDWLDTGLPTGSLKGLAIQADGSIFAIDATSQRIVRFSAR